MNLSELRFYPSGGPYRSCRADDELEITSAASFKLFDAFISPSAAIIYKK